MLINQRAKQIRELLVRTVLVLMQKNNVHELEEIERLEKKFRKCKCNAGEYHELMAYRRVLNFIPDEDYWIEVV